MEELAGEAAPARAPSCRSGMWRGPKSGSPRIARAFPHPVPFPRKRGKGDRVGLEPVPVTLSQRCADWLRKRRMYGAPYGIRTRVLALRGPRPGPLDEGSGVSPGRRRLDDRPAWHRSEEHTSELQSLMRNPYDVFCLKKKKQ